MMIELTVPNSTKKLIISERSTTYFATDDGERIPVSDMKEAIKWLQENHPVKKK